MNAYKTFIKKADLPANAKVHKNGDVSIKAETYTKGLPQFAYYKPTPKGFSLERTFWKGKFISQYNWAKVNNPDFKVETPVPASKARKKKTTAKKTPKTEPEVKTMTDAETIKDLTMKLAALSLKNRK